MKNINWKIRVFIHLLIILMCLWSLFPIYWLVITGFKTDADVVTSPPIFFPREVTLEHFYGIIHNLLNPALINIFFIDIVSTAFAVALGALAGFGFSRLRFKGRGSLLFWVISTRMFPPIVVVIPYFFLLYKFNLIDTLLGMIIVHLAMNIPFSIWIMKNYFDDLPKEIEEAAAIDGCSMFQSFLKISLPLSKSGIIACTVISIIFSWNEFLFALILTRKSAVTAPLVLSALESTVGISWGGMRALSIFIIFPLMILYFIIQRHLVRGLTLGAIK